MGHYLYIENVDGRDHKRAQIHCMKLLHVMLYDKFIFSKNVEKF